MKKNTHFTAKPFLKWAGGKGQLLDRLQEQYPNDLKNGEIKIYIEPFIRNDFA